MPGTRWRHVKRTDTLPQGPYLPHLADPQVKFKTTKRINSFKFGIKKYEINMNQCHTSFMKRNGCFCVSNNIEQFEI